MLAVLSIGLGFDDDFCRRWAWAWSGAQNEMKKRKKTHMQKIEIEREIYDRESAHGLRNPYTHSHLLSLALSLKNKPEKITKRQKRREETKKETSRKTRNYNSLLSFYKAALSSYCTTICINVNDA